MAMKVSVIIPALNAAAFVGAAIGSALAQSLSDLEVIVVDDGSTDETAAIVQSVMAADARVRLIQNETPRGVSAARNAALRAATGDWIALLDADDEFTPIRLERLVAEAEGRALDGLADNLQLVDFATKAPLGLAFPDDWMTTGGALALDELLDRDTPGNHDFRPFGLIKPLLRRQRLQSLQLGYAEDIVFSEDFLLYAQLVMSGFQIGLTPEAMYVYAVRAASASNKSSLDQGRNARDFLEVNRRILERYDLAIREAGLPVDRQAMSLRLKLKRREQAIRYWRFVNLAKDRHLIPALNAAYRVKPSYLTASLSAAVRRRLFRWTS
jgi:glycosyltransferase involved in cell wall biosynthesis